MRNLERNRFRTGIFGFVLTTILVGVTGPNCDQDAQAEFRATATSAIAGGVKTIVNGLIDGVAAAIENAGDGSSG